MLDADLRELLACFLAHRVEFLVAGGHAVAFHGYPRNTDDLDLNIRADRANAARIIAALDAFGSAGSARGTGRAERQRSAVAAVDVWSYLPPLWRPTMPAATTTAPPTLLSSTMAATMRRPPIGPAPARLRP